MQRITFRGIFKDEFDENVLHCMFTVKVELEDLPKILQALRSQNGVFKATAPSSYSVREHNIVIVYDKHIINDKQIKTIVEGEIR